MAMLRHMIAALQSASQESMNMKEDYFQLGEIFNSAHDELMALQETNQERKIY